MSSLGLSRGTIRSGPYSVTEVSTEEIGGCRTQQILHLAISRRVRESANNAGWSAVELATHQTGCTSKFIGNGLNAGFQFISVRIAPSSIVAKRFHPRDT